MTTFSLHESDRVEDVCLVRSIPEKLPKESISLCSKSNKRYTRYVMVLRAVINLRRTLFILPNLFTVGALFCGFYSILLASEAVRPWDYWAAAWLIAFAAVFSVVDGRVARLTRTQSSLGNELDRLACIVSFGVAPASLMFYWGLSSEPIIGAVIASVYLGAVMVRLAHSSSLARFETDRRYVRGLGSPLAATILAGLVAVHTVYVGELGAVQTVHGLVMLIMLFLAGLMLSPIKFRTFAQLHFSRRTMARAAIILGALTYIGVATTVELGLLAALVGYVGLHLAGVGVRLERRLLRRKRGPSIPDVVEELAVVDELIDEDENEKPAEVQGL